jgi:hypothetical protein
VPRDRLVDVGLVGVLGHHPIGEALVQVCSQLLGDAPVHGLADKRMRKAPPAVHLLLRPHKALPFK